MITWYLCAATPAIAGVILICLGQTSVPGMVEEFGQWVIGCSVPSNGKKPFLIFRPLLFVFRQILAITNGISHKGIKSGLQLMLYSYSSAVFLGLLALAIYVGLVIIAVILVLAIVGFILKFALSNHSPSLLSRSEDINEEPEPEQKKYKDALDEDKMRMSKSAGRKTEDLARLFGLRAKDIIEVSDDGSIFSGRDLVGDPIKIGEILEDGTVRDLRYMLGKPELGEIDEDAETRKKGKE